MNSRVLVSVIGLFAAIGAVAAVYVSEGVKRNALSDKTSPGTENSASVEASGALVPPASGRLAAFVIHKAPETVDAISFVDVAEAPKSLNDWKGRVVLLNLWATWCAPCRHEMPTLDALNAEFGGVDFEVVPLSLDRGGLTKPQKFFAEIEVKTMALFNDKSGKSGRKLRAVGMPTTILLGRDGRELGRIAGPAEWDSDAAKALIRSAIGAGS